MDHRLHWRSSNGRRAARRFASPPTCRLAAKRRLKFCVLTAALLRRTRFSSPLGRRSPRLTESSHCRERDGIRNRLCKTAACPRNGDRRFLFARPTTTFSKLRVAEAPTFPVSLVEGASRQILRQR